MLRYIEAIDPFLFSLSGVPLLATWAGLMWMYKWVMVLPGYTPDSKAWIQISSSIGAATSPPPRT